ncbi:glycogen synthase GlgA [soil metagenome]
MDILFVSTELLPYVKIGGLADVAAALPKALRALGHKVTLVVPRFPAFEEGGLLVARRLTPLRFDYAGEPTDVTLFDGRLASHVDVILVDAPGLYEAGSVYGDEASSPDNAKKFGILSAAAAEIARQRAATGQPYDVVVANDWPAAATSAHIVRLRSETPDLARTRTVFIVHNVEYQGVFPKEALPALGLPPSFFNVDQAEFYGKISLMKLGARSADAVVTVSPTYAREIVSKEGGYGLEGVFASVKERLTCILNGIDYGVWNPATDSAIASRYDAEDLSPKARCKGALQNELGLPIDIDVPLIANVGRMVSQKGTDLVATLLPKILKASEAQVVICGDGDPDLVEKITAAVKKSHGRAVFVRAAAENVVHRVFSASDLVLVPSRREPCGLVQMYAQRYGALPIVHATGGLVDTVVDCDAKLETGTGFVCGSEDELLAATERAIAAHAHERFPQLTRRVMRLDRSWDGPARRYEQLFKQLVTRGA